MNTYRKAIFEQSKVMQPSQATSTSAKCGACHNFTIHWIELMYEIYSKSSTTSTPNLRMDVLKKNAGKEDAILQKAFISKWEEGDYLNSDKMMLDLRKLSKKQEIEYSFFDINVIDQVIQNPNSSGIIYSFWYRDYTKEKNILAHTIGFFRELKISNGQLSPTNANIYAFDPNFGEYEFPSNKFNQWLIELIPNYSDKFEAHYIKNIEKHLDNGTII